MQLKRPAPGLDPKQQESFVETWLDVQTQPAAVDKGFQDSVLLKVGTGFATWCYLVHLQISGRKVIRRVFLAVEYLVPNCYRRAFPMHKLLVFTGPSSCTQQHFKMSSTSCYMAALISLRSSPTFKGQSISSQGIVQSHAHRQGQPVALSTSPLQSTQMMSC